MKTNANKQSMGCNLKDVAMRDGMPPKTEKIPDTSRATSCGE